MELKLSNRTALGKHSRKVRREGFIPAEIYGHGVKNAHVSVPVREFTKVYQVAGEHGIVTGLLDDGTKVSVIISGVHEDPLSGSYLAADFRQVRMDEKIQAKIPVVLVGEPLATKAGFVVLHVLHEIEVEGLPGDLPAKFEVSVVGLEKPGDHITVKDLTVPAKVKVHAESEATIANVQEKRVEEVVVAPVAPVATAEPAPGTAPTEEKK